MLGAGPNLGLSSGHGERLVATGLLRRDGDDGDHENTHSLSARVPRQTRVLRSFSPSYAIRHARSPTHRPTETIS